MASKDFSQKLKDMRLKAGYTQKQVYEHFNIPQSTFSSWEVGKSEPSGEMLIKLSDFYNCDLLKEFSQNNNDNVTFAELQLIEKYRFISDNLPTGTETVDYILNHEYEEAKELKQRIDELVKQAERIAELEGKISGTIHDFPVLAVYPDLHNIACAGNGYYFEDIPTDTIEVPYMEGADFIIGVNGDSMEPTYYDGDKVYVQKRQIIETGDIGIFFVNNECYIKEAGEDGLESHNPKYKTILGNENIQCIGKVLGKVESADEKNARLSSEDCHARNIGYSIAFGNKSKHKRS